MTAEQKGIHRIVAMMNERYVEGIKEGLRRAADHCEQSDAHIPIADWGNPRMGAAVAKQLSSELRKMAEEVTE